MTRGMLLVTGLGFAVAAGAASAQGFDPSRLYLKGFGGLEFAQDASVDVDTSLPLDLSFDLGYDTGYVLGAAAGYRVTDRVAVELEYAYRRADATVDVHFIDFGGDEPFEGSDSFDDRVVVQSGMVNLLYQFDGIGPAAISPYVGGGIGAATVDVRGEGSADPAFAWQAIAGVSYPIDDSLEPERRGALVLDRRRDLPRRGRRPDARPRLRRDRRGLRSHLSLLTSADGLARLRADGPSRPKAGCGASSGLSCSR